MSSCVTVSGFAIAKFISTGSFKSASLIGISGDGSVVVGGGSVVVGGGSVVAGGGSVVPEINVTAQNQKKVQLWLPCEESTN